MRAFMQLIRSPTRKLALTELKDAVQREVRQAMNDKIKPALVKSHEKIVEDWKTQIGFAAKVVIRGNSIAVYIYPTGPNKMIWVYVDQGTRPHTITARRAPRLAFHMTSDESGNPIRGGYEPKTLARPARTVSGGGYVRPPTVLVRPYSVQHPGSEGRGFTRQIAREIEPFFHREIDNAFRRIARRMNAGR